MKISYNDGDVVEEHIIDLVSGSKDVSSESSFAFAEFSDWPVRYHLCPERGNLLRHLDFSGLDVLELGAGMGGVSRFIAENAKSFLAVEGAPRRAQALKKRLRDLDNWEAIVENIGAFETKRRFDVVCLVGVLEYSELYVDVPENDSPFAKVLAKAHSFLKPGGAVIVAIENSNGIKYWAGAPEDHTGQMFDGICGYAPSKSPRTFSRLALHKLFEEVGLGEVEEFYPWPDYKTPHAVVSKRLADTHPVLAADMAAEAIMREPIEGVRYFPTTLAIYETALSGLFGELSNSFLFVGSPYKDSPILERLYRRQRTDKEIGWHYSLSRNFPIRTVLEEAAPLPIVRKELLRAKQADYGSKTVTWRPEGPVTALEGMKVDRLLRRAAYFGGRQAFEDQFYDFLSWSLGKWSVDEDHLDPVAIDAVVPNAIRTKNGYEVFDLEWTLAKPIEKSWFVFRNVCGMTNATWLFQNAEYANVEEVYDILCRRLGIEPDLEGALRKEAEVQTDICSFRTPDGVIDGLRARMKTPCRGSVFPRDARAEQLLRRDLFENPEAHEVLRSLQSDNQRLHEQLSKRCVRIGLALDARLRRIKPLFKLARSSYSLAVRKRH